MKSLAIKLSKVCNDLRLLSSGPRCGLREINLPPMQPGSSIMPGKVNPVIPEVVNMVCFRVIGSDLTVTMAAEAGQLQLNVFEPVIAACIFEAQTMFVNAARTLRVHCVEGITANPDVMRHYVDYSIGTVTALNPVIGYDKATELAAEAMKTGRGILELLREKKILTEEQIAEGARPGGDDGAGTSGMRRRAAAAWPRDASRSPLAGFVAAAQARRRRPAEGWRAFEGSWSVVGPAAHGPRRGRRPAAVVEVSGAVVLDEGRGPEPRLPRRGDRLRRRPGREPRPRRVDRRARRPRSSAALKGEPLETGRRIVGTITGGTGRYAGLDGRVLAHLAVRRRRPRTASIQGRAVRPRGARAAEGRDAVTRVRRRPQGARRPARRRWRSLSACGSRPSPEGLVPAGVAPVRALRRGDRRRSWSARFPILTSSVLALAAAVLTGTLAPAKAYSGFANGTILLIVVAFLVARAVVKCGLGERLGHLVVSVFGRSTLGLGYSIFLVDGVIAPAFPSNTARSGVLYPLVLSRGRGGRRAAGRRGPPSPGQLPDVLGHRRA